MSRKNVITATACDELLQLFCMEHDVEPLVEGDGFHSGSVGLVNALTKTAAFGVRRTDLKASALLSDDPRVQMAQIQDALFEMDWLHRLALIEGRYDPTAFVKAFVLWNAVNVRIWGLCLESGEGESQARVEELLYEESPMLVGETLSVVYKPDDYWTSGKYELPKTHIAQDAGTWIPLTFKRGGIGVMPVDLMKKLVAVHLHQNPSTTNVDAKNAVHDLSLAQKMEYLFLWKKTVQQQLAAARNDKRKRLRNAGKSKASGMAAGVAPQIEENQRLCCQARQVFKE